jgi:hypothetical protein
MLNYQRVLPKKHLDMGLPNFQKNPDKIGGCVWDSPKIHDE